MYAHLRELTTGQSNSTTDIHLEKRMSLSGRLQKRHVRPTPAQKRTRRSCHSGAQLPRGSCLSSAVLTAYITLRREGPYESAQFQIHSLRQEDLGHTCWKPRLDNNMENGSFSALPACSHLANTSVLPPSSEQIPGYTENQLRCPALRTEQLWDSWTFHSAVHRWSSWTVACKSC